MPPGDSADRPAVRRDLAGSVTRDQADAYRFGLRRLEAALVRADPVPVHEQLRSQRRAAVAGALLGLLALGGVAVWSLIDPRPDWTRQDVVMGEQSGALYVVAHAPDRLVPVANLAAARLVMGALREGGVVDADPGTAVPVAVPDDDLAAAARTPAAAVAGAWGVRPEVAGVPPRWAVCDETVLTEGAPGRLAGTSVLAGAAGTAPVAPGDGVLVAVPGGSTWLVTGGRRHRVDGDDGAVLGTLGLTGRPARPASAALVSALPQGPPLETPDIPGTGTGATWLAADIGDVVVTRPVGGPPRHYVVLADGLQELPPSLAAVLRAGTARTHDLAVSQVSEVPMVDRLDVAGWPSAAPRLLEPAAAPVLCWTWSGAEGAPPEGAVFTGAALPAPERAVTLDLAGADGAGGRVDSVVLDPKGGGPVRAGGPGGGAQALYLVSTGAVAYRIVDDETARHLGVTAAAPAPEAAVALLPAGPDLDRAQARQLVDVLLPRG